MTTEDTYRLLRAFCDELARCGLTEACTCPGSRNTPIVLSLVREPRIRSWSHIDERDAGFFAVGAARASGRPVAVTCTSGTAAANLVPAVVEAFWGCVPMIVLTADRPAQLRDVGAGQAIDQIKLYGDHVKWFCEVEPPPSLDAPAMAWMRQLACRAYWTALEGRPGPVHLNLPLREPLVLGAALDEELEHPGRADGRPWVTRRSTSGQREATSVPATRARTVLVVGQLPIDPDGRLVQAISAFGERHRVPILADPLSPARTAATAIATYDLLLRDERTSECLAPQDVIRLGDLPTSKPLRAWLAHLPADTHQVVIDPQGSWQDPAGVAEEMWTGDPAATLERLGDEHPTDADETWLPLWVAADRAAAAALSSGLDEALSEPLVAGGLGTWLDPEVTLFVASSMPIRDVELYMPAAVPLPRILSNRGANGIDGTVSSAFGAAAADKRPVVLLIGDVALIHDLGGLLAARRLGLELTVVVLNNDGGGIFHFLAISGEADVFEQHVATSHGLDFAVAAQLYGARHRAPRTVAELREALAQSIGSGTVTIIEVRTVRAENFTLHRDLATAGLAAARQRLS